MLYTHDLFLYYIKVRVLQAAARIPQKDRRVTNEHLVLAGRDVLAAVCLRADFCFVFRTTKTRADNVLYSARVHARYFFI